MSTTPVPVSSTRNPAIPERDAAAYIAVSPAYLRKARRRGVGPAFIRLGRTIRYRTSDLDRWLNAHCIEPQARKAKVSA
jgi:hypothetical protein